MPTHTPKLLGNVEKLLQEKLQEALSNREKEITVVAGITMQEADRTMHKLRAMRAGLKQYQPVGSVMQVLAANKHIRFFKEYDAKLPVNHRHSVIIMIYGAEHGRPSDAVKQSLEDYYAGRRSTPF